MNWAWSIAFLALAVPACSSHGGGAVQAAGKPVVITEMGRVGTADDSLLFQAAADEAELRKVPLVIPRGTTINLRGNVYLGDLTLAAEGAVINCQFDDAFRYRGTARLRVQGCVMTKAAAQAGYGRRTVSIYFDALTINTIRSASGGEPRAGLLLENTAHFVGHSLSATTRWDGDGGASPFDFRTGVQGVRIDRIEAHMVNQRGSGGFWIRNDSPVRATSDIDIGSIDMDGMTSDELLAIFNSAQPGADLHDIHIGQVTLRPDGGSGQGLSIFRNAGDYDRTRMNRISIDRVSVDVGRIGPNLGVTHGVFAAKVMRVDARLGSVSLRYSGPWVPQLPYVFGLRFVPGTGQQQPLYVPSVTVDVSARNTMPKGTAAMIWGPVVVDRLVVRGAGTGFKNIAIGANDLRDVDAQIDNIPPVPFATTTRIRGSMNGRPIASR